MTKPEALVRPLLNWYRVHARDLPWRKTKNPYAIWIAEVMLQQTQVKTVMPYWQRWMRELPSIKSLARARMDRILKLWEGLGYYHRARNLHQAARVVVRRHGGVFPERFEEVLALPGVGRYTAGAICSIAFNQPAPILDGNVMRVLARVYGIRQDPRESETNAKLWRWSEELVRAAARLGDQKEPRCSFFNQAMMELGATLCTPRQPDCAYCPVRPHCVAHRDQLTDRLPNLKPRPAVQERRFTAFVIVRDGKLLVRRRPRGTVNAGLWEFPNLETKAKRRRMAEEAARLLGFRPRELKAWCSIRHTIMNQRIVLEVFGVEAQRGDPIKIEAGQWRTLGQLERMAFPSAHRKVVDHARILFRTEQNSRM